MLNLILFGPPGSGKGTQAANLVDKYELIHLSTGDLLRQQIADKTKLGLEAKNYMDNGQLVPDAVVIGMISDKLDHNPQAKGFIFDGFPRTIAQAEALDELLEGKNAPIDRLIAIEVGEEELVKRLLERGKTSGRADDQDETVIRERIEVYRRETEPVAGYYRKQNKYVAVKGDQTIPEVFESLVEEIDKIA